MNGIITKRIVYIKIIIFIHFYSKRNLTGNDKDFISFRKSSLVSIDKVGGYLAIQLWGSASIAS